MNILIIGGAGFIGSHLANYHLSLHDSVTVVDNLSSGKLVNISGHLSNPKFTFCEADFLNWPKLNSTLAECDIVYDLAAIVGIFNVIEHPITTLHVNINITEQLLSQAARLKKKPLVVIASSSEVYGSQSTAMKENEPIVITTTCKAHASYMISKLCNEVTGIAYYKEENIPVIVVRIFNTIGPKQLSHYGMVVPRFVQQALNHEPLTIFSDGLQTRCFCDVRDLCTILHQLTLNEKSYGQIINVGSDEEITILDLANLIIKLTQSKSTLAFQIYDQAYGAEYINIQNRKPDLRKLNSIIDYSPQWTLAMTIKDIVSALNKDN